MKIKITFTEALLGTLSGDPELATEFILSKHPSKEIAEDERKALEEAPEEVLQKSSTIFARTEDGVPMLWNYMMQGFFKEACSMLRRIPATKSKSLTAYRKVIDGLIFVAPRKIPIDVVGEITILERPLRAETAQGPRIALARSESIPAGSSIAVDITCLDKKLDKLIAEWLDYGRLRGLGQWRNAGFGTFSYEQL